MPDQPPVFARGAIIRVLEGVRNGFIRVRTLDARTGALVAERLVQGVVRAVSDDGIAYVVPGDMYDNPGLAALHLEDGQELWRVDDQMRSFQVAVSTAAITRARVGWDSTLVKWAPAAAKC